MDPDDKRAKYVQIAASIRAAILTGELVPGSQLPTGGDLSKFFGVASQTVRDAIRLLREEGFVRSTAGSGVYVLDQAALPGPADSDHPLAGAATFVYEMGQMKQQVRTGWALLGIPSPESVAEHSFRVAVTGLILAAMEGADTGRVAALCVMHDAHETRIGDVPSVGRAYVTTAKPEAVTAHQTAAMPPEAAKAIQDLVAEYEANETLEARLAHDADKLEMLAQAIEYAQAGHDTSGWQDTAVAALRTRAGGELAQAIKLGNPQWFAPFTASYHELRKSTRAHRDD